MENLGISREQIRQDLGFLPRAEKVELLLPTSDTKEKRISMNKENDGCWSCEVDNEAEGKPYLFGITHPGTGEKQSFEKRFSIPMPEHA